jgi:hypothetical protein
MRLCRLIGIIAVERERLSIELIEQGSVVVHGRPGVSRARVSWSWCRLWPATHKEIKNFARTEAALRLDWLSCNHTSDGGLDLTCKPIALGKESFQLAAY